MNLEPSVGFLVGDTHCLSQPLLAMEGKGPSGSLHPSAISTGPGSPGIWNKRLIDI